MSNKEICRERIEKLCRRLEEDGIGASVIEDNEAGRTANIRYLSGMNGDALLFVIPKGPGKDRTVLLPWDVILAEKTAWADEIIPYTECGRVFENALKIVLKKEGVPAGTKVELPSNLSHPRFEKVKELDWNFICRENGTYSYLSDLRMIKNEEEIRLIKEGCRLTNRLLEELEMEIRKDELRTEIDVALFIERRSRTLGCEGPGFETICAGPGRSWGIHAFPLFTAGEFATRGLSLVDFGVSYCGYSTDITASFIRGPLSRKQKEMVRLVEEAHYAAAEILKPGVTTMQTAGRVAEIFEAEGWVMPHALGHAVGLEVHENPILRSERGPDTVLEPGMFLTLEPGLYDAREGGVRLENDFLITETGAECLTKSRIITLPDRI